MKITAKKVLGDIRQDLQDLDKQLSSGTWTDYNTLEDDARETVNNNIAYAGHHLDEGSTATYYEQYLLIFNAVAKKAGLLVHSDTMNLENVKKLEKAAKGKDALKIAEAVVVDFAKAMSK